MNSWRIFRHAFLMVARNLGPLVQISLLPGVICTAILLGLDQIAGATDLFGGPINNLNDPFTEQLAANEPTGLYGFLSFASIVLTMVWIAVAWHRFILLGERPKRLLPSVHRAELGAYLFVGLKLLLLAIVSLVPALLVVMLSATIDGVFATLLPIIVSVAASTVFYRLGALLPSAALGKTQTFKQAWSATNGQTPTLFGLAIITALLGVFVDSVSSAIGIGPLANGVSWILSILGMFLTVSIVTTIYGVFVENRDLT